TEVIGENGLGDLLGNAEIEPVNASAVRKIHRSEHIPAGVNLDASLSTAGVEKSSGESQRFEDLERAGMHHRCAVPVERRGLRIDQMACHTASLKLCGQEQSGRPRAYDKHRRAERLDDRPRHRQNNIAFRDWWSSSSCDRVSGWACEQSS